MPKARISLSPDESKPSPCELRPFNPRNYALAPSLPAFAEVYAAAALLGAAIGTLVALLFVG